MSDLDTSTQSVETLVRSGVVRFRGRHHVGDHVGPV